MISDFCLTILLNRSVTNKFGKDCVLFPGKIVRKVCLSAFLFSALLVRAPVGYGPAESQFVGILEFIPYGNPSGKGC